MTRLSVLARPMTSVASVRRAAIPGARRGGLGEGRGRGPGGTLGSERLAGAGRKDRLAASAGSAGMPTGGVIASGARNGLRVLIASGVAGRDAVAVPVMGRGGGARDHQSTCKSDRNDSLAHTSFYDAAPPILTSRRQVRPSACVQMRAMSSSAVTDMEVSGGNVAARSPRVADISLDLSRFGPAVAGFLVPFVLVVYLALEGGGYDEVVRSQVGMAVWWIVLLGAAVGLLPAARLPWSARIGGGLMLAFACWTALGISWSESSERSFIEVARVLTYLGVFALALLMQSRDSLRRAVAGVGAAIALIGVLALLSRLHPAWFPRDVTAQILPVARARLNYPLNYWNGLAALMAVGVPLLLGLALRARHLVTRALAAAAIPMVSLTAFYTLSRGGAAEIALGLIVFFAIYPRRVAAVVAAVPAALGAAVLIVAATQRDALQQGLGGSHALSQGNEMFAMTIVVCAGVALLGAAIGLAERHQLGPRPSVSRPVGHAALAALLTAAIIAFLALGGPGKLGAAWRDFKKPPVGEGLGTSPARLISSTGSGRYQLWSSALRADATAPATGIGPGTFEYWEERDGAIPAFVRNAHSLYFETLAELGVVGLVVVAGLVLWVLGIGVTRAVRSGSETRRSWVAIATAACAAFVASTAVDWTWQLAVLPVAFLLLAAAILGPDAESSSNRSQSRFRRGFPPVGRPILAVGALGAIVAIAIPLAGTTQVRASQDAVRSNHLDAALKDARQAEAIQPYSATAHLQEGLVLERQGDLSDAAAAVRQASEDESTNWRTWLTLSRIDAERGRAHQAVTEYRKARSLNPLSQLFQ